MSHRINKSDPDRNQPMTDAPVSKGKVNVLSGDGVSGSDTPIGGDGGGDGGRGDVDGGEEASSIIHTCRS